MIPFKDRLAQGGTLLGLWQALANNYTAEICARAGYDWLLFDGEHSPNTAQTLLGQLQAIAPFPVDAIARVPAGDPVFIKQYLDLGFNSLLVPMVDTAEQARAIVSACRYPPAGIRGVASATARATGFGADPAYLKEAASRITLIIQIESSLGLANIDAIGAVDGVDALFIGPADLSASMGHLGNPWADEVQQAITHAKARIDLAGKPAGIFGLSLEDVRNRRNQGFRFISTGSDIGLLSRAAADLVGSLRP